MSIELKIKAKHLALEPAIIRHEENKLLKTRKRFEKYGFDKLPWDDPRYKAYLRTTYTRDKIHSHRILDVRNEARATHLARAYLDNMPYKAVEGKRKLPIEDDYQFRCEVIPRVIDMVNKYNRLRKEPEDFQNKYWNKYISKEEVCKWLDVEPIHVPYKPEKVLTSAQLKRLKDR